MTSCTMHAGVLSGDLQIELSRSKDPFSWTRSTWLKSFVVKLGSPPGGEMCFEIIIFFFVNMKSDDERWYPADERTSDAGQEGGDAVGLAAAIEIRIPGCQNWGCHLVASRESQ